VRDLVSTRKVIFAIWHSRILLFAYLYKGWNAAVLVSRSADGEIIARILQRQGHEAVRGSSRKGGIPALGRLIRKLEGRSRLPTAQKKVKIFSSWDRCILPLPMARCRVVYGNPVHVPVDADPDQLIHCKNRLEEELCRVTEEADRYFGHKIT